MKISALALAPALVLIMVTTCTAPVQAKPAASLQKSAVANNAKSCSDFVQNFYNWYVVQMNLKTGPASLDKILTMKPQSFSAELAKQLKADSAASAKVKDEIVGLDFDPILATQSDTNKYVAGAVTTKGATYLVPMFDRTENKIAKEPAVTAELIYSNGNFVFTNFHYQKTDIPVNENLLGRLKTLRDDRAKYDREHKKK